MRFLGHSAAAKAQKLDTDKDQLQHATKPHAAMLLWLAWFATVSGASAFYVRCDQSDAAVRPAIATRSTPVALAMPWREEVVRLNVGGTLFTTKLETLRAAHDSKLASDVEIWRVDDRNTYDDREKGAFFDKDPEAFAWVLGFLRNGCRLVGTPPVT